MVNYDEIKRFIRQEIIKMFDGNWQLAGWQWGPPAPPSCFPPRPGLLFLKAQDTPPTRPPPHLQAYVQFDCRPSLSPALFRDKMTPSCPPRAPTGAKETDKKIDIKRVCMKRALNRGASSSRKMAGGVSV